MTNKVILYTTPTCGGCVPVKEKLKQKGIEYEERDITKETDDELFERYEYNIMSTPSMVILKDNANRPEVYRGSECHTYVESI